MFFEKKIFFRLLDLGELSHFLSIAPHFWRPFFKKIFCENFQRPNAKILGKFSEIFEKKVFFRVLDLGELSHFLSIAPYFWRPFSKKNILIFFQRPNNATQKIQSFFEKAKFQDFGSRRIKSFPIFCTPLFFSKKNSLRGLFGGP